MSNNYNPSRLISTDKAWVQLPIHKKNNMINHYKKKMLFVMKKILVTKNVICDWASSLEKVKKKCKKCIARDLLSENKRALNLNFKLKHLQGVNVLQIL